MMKATRIIAVVLLVAGVASVVFWPGHHKGPTPAAAATLPATTAPLETLAAPTTVLPVTTTTTTTTAPPVPVTTTKPVTTAPAARARCQPAGGPTATAFPGPDPRDGKQWVTVGSLAGICNGQSPVFHLTGVDTRLLFRSDADSLAVFLVDAKLGLDATSGYSDGDCSGQCSENQVLVDKAGDYYLMVQAGDGPWQVAVQEYR